MVAAPVQYGNSACTHLSATSARITNYSSCAGMLESEITWAYCPNHVDAGHSAKTCGSDVGARSLYRDRAGCRGIRFAWPVRLPVHADARSRHGPAYRPGEAEERALQREAELHLRRILRGGGQSAAAIVPTSIIRPIEQACVVWFRRRTWPFHQTCNSSSHSSRLTTVRLWRTTRISAEDD